jgi:2-keto-3-deoxy-L-rhamnonate aldolase RhmA
MTQSSQMKLMLITGDPAIAAFAIRSGVDRVFVDLETIGKQERQGHKDTWISAHSMESVGAVRKALGADKDSLLVRLNPLYEGSPDEVEEALARGADFLMLPMFRRADEVARFADLVRGRAKVIPLLETREAAAEIENIVRVPGLSEIFIGLNDLHLSLGMRFMFEPLAKGMLDGLAKTILGAGLRFGFGGIGRIGEGTLPAEWILGEHLRLGSNSVILSRSFHGRSRNMAELTKQIDLPAEIARFRTQEKRLSSRTASQIEQGRQKVIKAVDGIVSQGGAA